MEDVVMQTTMEEGWIVSDYLIDRWTILQVPGEIVL